MLEEESLRRNPGEGIPEEGSWRSNPEGGILAEESWKRNPGGGPWRGNLEREIQ